MWLKLVSFSFCQKSIFYYSNLLKKEKKKKRKQYVQHLLPLLLLPVSLYHGTLVGSFVRSPSSFDSVFFVTGYGAPTVTDLHVIISSFFFFFFFLTAAAVCLFLFISFHTLLLSLCCVAVATAQHPARVVERSDPFTQQQLFPPCCSVFSVVHFRTTAYFVAGQLRQLWIIAPTLHPSSSFHSPFGIWFLSFSL